MHVEVILAIIVDSVCLKMHRPIDVYVFAVTVARTVKYSQDKVSQNTRNLTFYLRFIDNILCEYIVNKIICNCIKLVKVLNIYYFVPFNQVQGGLNGEDGQSVQFSVGEV